MFTIRVSLCRVRLRKVAKPRQVNRPVVTRVQGHMEGAWPQLAGPVVYRSAVIHRIGRHLSYGIQVKDHLEADRQAASNKVRHHSIKHEQNI